MYDAELDYATWSAERRRADRELERRRRYREPGEQASLVHLPGGCPMPVGGDVHSLRRAS